MTLFPKFGRGLNGKFYHFAAEPLAEKPENLVFANRNHGSDLKLLAYSGLPCASGADVFYCRKMRE